jgi:SAM-dependent methyltransferase
MTEKERNYWDYWNTQYRSGAIVGESIAGQLGAAVLSEISSLSLTNPRVVEIGCGTGWVAERLIGCGSYLGLDLSRAAIEVARRRVPGGRFVVTDFLEWDSHGELFDIVLLVDSIAYFHDQDSAIAKASRLLDRHGYLILSTVNPFVYSRISWVGPPAEGQVRKWLSRSALHSLLERGSFNLLRSYTVLPAGDRGILWFLNSRRLNLVARLVVPETWIRRAKELCGLGQYRIAVAQYANRFINNPSIGK